MSDQIQQVMPYLYYLDATKALDFVVEAFGFEVVSAVRDQDGTVWTSTVDTGSGRVMIGPGVEGFGTRGIEDHQGLVTSRVFVPVTDIEAHFARAKAAGAQIRDQIQEHFSGSRIYVAADCGGQQWIFSERRD